MDKEGNNENNESAEGVELTLMSSEELDEQIAVMEASEVENAAALSEGNAEVAPEPTAEDVPDTGPFKIDMSEGVGSNPYDNAAVQEERNDKDDVWKGTSADLDISG